jgi:hypothetical protein
MRTLIRALSIVFVSIGASVFAQGDLYQLRLSSVSESGLHRLQLQPDWRAAMKADRSDLRITDNIGKECPFVFRQPTLSGSLNTFVQYHILSQTHFKSYSELVIENPTKDLISNLVFVIRNSDAHKYCAVEGSEDLKQWFSISAKQELQLVSEISSGSTVKSINIPASEYPYIRIHIEDWHSRPLLIKAVGHYQTETASQKLLSFPVFFQEEKSKTKGQQQFNIYAKQQEIHDLKFSFEGPRLYKRSYRLFTGSSTKADYQIAEGIFSSDQESLINLSDLRTEYLVLVIENGENPPLHIKELIGTQVPSYLVFDADSSKSYEMSFGDRSLSAVNYDLEHFVGADISYLPEVSVTSINKESQATEAKVEEAPKPFYERKEFLWACIGIGAFVVLWFSRSLLKDLRKKN